MKTFAIQVIFDNTHWVGNLQQAFEHFCLGNSDRDADNRRQLGFVEPILEQPEFERLVCVVDCPHLECEHKMYASVIKPVVGAPKMDCLDFRLTDFDVDYEDAVLAHTTFNRLGQEFANRYKGWPGLSKPQPPVVFVGTLLYETVVVNTPIARRDSAGLPILSTTL